MLLDNLLAPANGDVNLERGSPSQNENVCTYRGRFRPHRGQLLLVTSTTARTWWSPVSAFPASVN